MQTDKSFKYWQWRTIIVSMFVYSIFYFVRKNFSIAMPGLTAEYGISNTSFGIIIAIGSLIYGTSRFINGFIVERMSTKLFMAIGLFLCALANFCFGFGYDLSYLITGVHEGPQVVNMLILVMGVTIALNQYFQGMGFPPCARMLPQWIAPNELATKMSIWNTSHSIGASSAVLVCGLIMTNMGADMSGNSSVVATIASNLSSSINGWEAMGADAQNSMIMSYATHYGAWKWCFIIPGIVAVGGAVLCLMALYDTPQSVGLPELDGTHTGKEEIHGKKGSHKAFLQHMVFRNKWIWILAIANIYVYILRMGILDWGPKFLTEDRGMNIKNAAWSVAVFELTAIVGTIFGGWFSDRYLKGLSPRYCFVSIFTASVALALFSLVDLPPVLSTIVLALSGFFIYGPQALVGISAANLSTKEASATSNGFMGICGYLGAALSAVGVGYIADNFGWNWVFVTFVTVGVIGSFLFLLMWKAPHDGYERAREFTAKMMEKND